MRFKKKYILILFMCIIPITSIAFTYGVIRSKDATETVSKGVVGDTVYIDDYDSDYYYYMGQNYTNSTNGSLPTLDNKNIYSDSNLVKTTVIYHGTSYDNKYTGYVSLDEKQSKYVYYKYYPLNNGYINIELIDNPFSYHPDDLAFNGWVTNYKGATISLDNTYYTRYISVPVSSNEITIDIYASWTEATTSYVNNSFSNALSDLDDAGMKKVETMKNIYDYPSVEGYYKSETITTTSVKSSGRWGSTTTTYGTCTDCYDSSGTYYSSYQCSAPSFNRWESGTKTNTCTVYKLQTSSDTFDLEATYFTKINWGFNEANLTATLIGSEPAEMFKDTPNMSGYFRLKSLSYGESFTNLYDSSGNVSSGTCNSYYGCSYYELIQFYKDDGSEELFDEDTTYYYLVTRDTNILVMNSSISSTWSSTSKPFTLTGINNGTDYNPTWNVSNLSVVCYSDVRIENLTINSRQSNTKVNPSNSNSNKATFYGNYYNVKIGRGIKKSGSYVNFTSILGGYNSTSTVGSKASPKKYKLIIESGFYNSISLTKGSTYNASTLYVEMYGVYGNDYDRILENNDNLDVYYCAAGGWSGYVHSSDDTTSNVYNTVVKSGSYGTGKFSDLMTGMYVGGRSYGTYYAPRALKVEGGYIYNLIGGPFTDSSKAELNDTYIYMTGGSIDMITGAAGKTTTYGNKVIQITGGTVNYSVFGGSNGYTGSSTDGTLTGDTYIYVGGIAVIGSDNITDTLWGAESGSVFGAGNGNTSYATIGSVDHSNIIIADSAVIKKNVYGSGNYGTVGYSSADSSSTNIRLIGGTVNGSVFGSGNQSGSGSSSLSTSINIVSDGGTVLDSIYGGSNQKGTVYGDTFITLVNGNIKNTYGGGLGEDTYVSGNVDVTVGNDSTKELNVTGSVYGGSALGVVNSTSKNTTKTNYTTNVTVNNGTINRVFGGGMGTSDVKPYVAGDVNVTVNGGTITNLFGGNDANGQPNGTVTVTLNSGTVINAYGGGNNTLVSNTLVYQKGSTVTNLFGGSNQSGDVVSSKVYVSDGTTTNLYGGNNIAGSTETSNVYVTGGVVESLYGGGSEATTGTSNVSISSGTITNAYGGGEKASIETSTNVNVTGGTVGTVYGGSNVSGDVPVSNVEINGGTITDVYGGNNQGGVTTKSNVSLLSGTVTSAYGGGNQAEVTTSNVTLNGGTLTNIYGGGNQAGVTTTNVDLISGTSDYVFGGSNSSGSVDVSNVTSTNPTDLTVTNVYGGNNQGGLTKETNVTLDGGTYTNLYGGGNMAPTNYTKVNVNNIKMSGEFFGGGNQADVNYDTDVTVKNSTIDGDLFGGGNLGAVSGDTTVYISNTTINSSAYAGGNGATATVIGNTKLNIDNNSVIKKHVFGGGNAANTGNEENNNSKGEVNIVGASIGGNVYGGANTAVLYGEAFVKIGKIDDLISSDIKIEGTVFGGGEANASGSEEYDYSFISVTKGIQIDIDGEDYDTFYIKGSIFGSGNASSTEGYSYINISNYGSFDDYQENVSIQRADIVTIKNSAIKLSGTTDRTNEYSNVKFSISRVKELKLANNSTLFLDTGTNLLEKFSSLKIDGSTETKATVTIDDDGNTTRNVNNRVYMLEGKNMNVALNQAITSYGEVSGMTFFGMYQLDRNNEVMTAFYDDKYDNGDTPASGEFYTFTSGSYVLGLHNTNHDITKDGFYSNFENDGAIKVNYIEPTPSDAAFYMWVIGESVTTYEFDLTASKYATLGTYELPLVSSSGANTTYEILGFNYQNVEDGFTLVDPSEISRINKDGKADDVMGLTMEASNTGFVTKGNTVFKTDEDATSGTTSYQSENSSAVPSFIFYLYHSKNLTKTRDIGTVVISLVQITPIDDLNNEVTRININVNLSSALYSNNEYEGAMSSGEKYDLFASTQTNITTKSTLSAYYSLYMETDKNYYKSDYKHALVSSYVLPVGTKITMIDKINGPTYYYHVIDEDDYTKALKEYDEYNECSYYFSDFIAMGSTSSDNNYNEVENMDIYYDENLGIIQEEFIFIVDFGDTDISGNKLSNTLLIELRNGDDQTLIGVLGIQHSNLTYNLYDNDGAVIDVDGSLSKSDIYVGDSVNLNLTTNFIQPTVSGASVVDTTYFDKRLGVYITIYDSNGNQLNNSSLLGLSYELDGVTYYPRMDGSIRIKLADKVANVFSKIKINTSNVNLASGDYTMKIESFGSPDGIYFGKKSSDSVTIPFKIINSLYGLKVTLPDTEMIIDKSTGYTSLNNNVLVFNLKYSSNLDNPNIRLSLYRRNYDEIYDTSYSIVDLSDYITNKLTEISDNEYMFIETPSEEMDKYVYLKSDLMSGTYKFVFKLYDGDTFIGDVSEYIIIK